MSFDKIHAARLTQLADRLDSDVPLLVGRFDYACIYQKSVCGSVGCALGEAAMMWPDKIPLVSMMGIGGRHSYRLGGDGGGFFGLSTREYMHLFVPDCQLVDEYGGKNLSNDATRHEVAANIRCFLERKGAEEGAGA